MGGPIRAILWTTRCTRTALLFVLGAALLSTVSRADDMDRDATDPASRVARVSYLKGDVSVSLLGGEAEESDRDNWQTARLNLPLVPGDALATDTNARAELQLGDAALQVEEETRVTLDTLDEDHIRVTLDQGSVFLRVRDENDQVEIRTRNAQVRLDRPGRYRITSWNDDVTQVQVRDGDANVQGERQSYPVHDGEQLTLRGTRRASVEYEDLPAQDDFDRWADARNERAVRSVTTRYVSSEVIGYEDLDDYGYWRYEGDYGYVWSPTTVVVNWAPYRYGHWAWIAPWGWTWVDDAPWGFAPFHYGRWARLHNRWCWVPGPRTLRPVYAPALVAWMGAPGVSITVRSGPGVGWIPLGPRDVYRPWYRHSDGYARHVNLSSGRLSRQDFDRGWRRQPHERDYSNRAAATLVAASAFQRGESVQRHIMKPHGHSLTVLDRAPQRPDGLLNSPRSPQGGAVKPDARPHWSRDADRSNDTRFNRAPSPQWRTERPDRPGDNADHPNADRSWRDPRNQPRLQPAPAPSPALRPDRDDRRNNNDDHSNRSGNDRPGVNQNPPPAAPEPPRERRSTTPWARPDTSRESAPAPAQTPVPQPEPRIWKRTPAPDMNGDRRSDIPVAPAPRPDRGNGWRDQRAPVERAVTPTPRVMPHPAPPSASSPPNRESPHPGRHRAESTR